LGTWESRVPHLRRSLIAAKVGPLPVPAVILAQPHTIFILAQPESPYLFFVVACSCSSSLPVPVLRRCLFLFFEREEPR
jgi:hypothetical protein